jgi:hypothetical protein
MEFAKRFRSFFLLAVTTAAYTVITVFGVSVLVAPQAATAVQSVPYKVNFQGRLTDASGNALSNGTYNVKFRLYDAATSGTNKWEEDRVYGTPDNRVTVQNGLFNIQFGDVTALSPSLFNRSTTGDLWLEVELPTPATATSTSPVWTELPMTPRQPLASAPYAFNSDTLDGLDSSGFVQLNPSGAQSGSINVQNNVTAGGALQGATATVTGASGLTLGSTTAAGGIIFNDGTANARTVTLGTTGLTNTYSLTLPTSAPSTSQCLSTSSGSASQLVFIGCPTGGNASTALSNLASVAINTSLLPASNNTIDAGSAALGFRTGYFATSILAPAIDTISSGILSIAPGTASSISLGKDTTIVAAKTFTVSSGLTSLTGATTGDALNVSNSTSTGNIAVFKDGATAVFTIANEGAVRLKTLSDSPTALEVINSGNGTVFSVDTGANLVRASGTGSNISLTSGTGAIQIGADNTYNLALDDNEIMSRNNGAADTLYVQKLGGGFRVQANTTLFKDASDNTTAFQIQQNGSAVPILNVDTSNRRVGIGMDNPASALDVLGNTTADALNVSNSTSTGNIAVFKDNTTGVFTIANGGAVLAKTVADSATAFQIQDTLAVDMLTIDTLADRLIVGEPDTTGTLLVLDTKTDAGDPAGTNGGMYYNSNNNKFRCYEESRWTDCTSSAQDYDLLDKTDDFITGLATTGNIGDLGWTLGAGTAAVKAGEQNHPGMYTIASTTTSGTIGRITMSGAAATASMVAGDANYVAAIVRPLSGTTTMSVRVGLTNNPATSAEGAQGIYWAFTPATSANWRTVTRDGVGATTNSTATAYTAGTWYKLEIKKNNSGNWEFYLNGTLQFTHSANIPTASTAMYPIVAIETSNTTTKTLDVDWFRLRSTVLTR